MPQKSTPGPWVNDSGVVNGRETRARFAPGVSIDIFNANDWGGELAAEGLANAALIAAAPDLWAVATDLEAALEDQIADQRESRCLDDPDDAEYHVVITAKQWRALGETLRKAETQS